MINEQSSHFVLEILLTVFNIFYVVMWAEFITISGKCVKGLDVKVRWGSEFSLYSYDISGCYMSQYSNY
jgi:hypothetical protein